MRKLSLLFATLLILVGCSAAQIVSAINTALQVALQAAAVTGNIPPSYSAYVSAALNCIDFAAAETGSTHSSLEKSASITMKCSALVAPALPPGTPQNLVGLASAIAGKIAMILENLPATKYMAQRGNAPIAPPPDVKLSSTDRAKLRSISESAKAARRKLYAIDEPRTF